MKHTLFTAAVTAAVVACVPLYGQAPTDPQIVGIVQTANNIDMDQAKIALRKSKSPQVKDFANQMMADHTELEESVSGLAKKLGVTQQQSETSGQLKRQAAEEARKLRSLHGKAFDQEYAAHEVAYHQAVIDSATKTLIPNAKNEQLKSALQGASPMLQAHLQRAQQLQQSLGGK